MVKSFAVGLLAGCVLTGILWYVTGRVNYGSVQELAEQISDAHRESKQISDTLRARYDKIAGTVADLDSRSARIKSISLTVTDRSEELADRSGRIESGITDVKTAVDRIENRNREIVGIVGELRKVNEDFYQRVR